MAYRDRFCAEASAVAGTLADIVQADLKDRDSAQVERCFTRLARLRSDLASLLREQAVIAASRGYRGLRYAERRAMETQAPFDGDPRRVLEHWNRVLQTARVAVTFDRQPLYTPATEGWDVGVQRWAALNQAMILMHEFVNSREAQAEQAKEDGYFTDIPLPMSLFMSECHAAYRVCLAQKRRAPMRFVDVGCGGGIKVLMAAQIFAEAHGLEVDPNFYQAAERLLGQVGRGRALAIEGDALTFEGYQDYDVIYFYQPIRDPDLLIEMERRIVEQAFAGTVIVAPYIGFQERGSSYGCGQITRNVWVTGTPQAEADALIKKAEQTSPVICPLPLSDLSQVGILRPLAEALDTRGFVIA
ncbi:MAG: hypothetical protein AAF393_00245 [Pseudomonadota bacterium]